MYEATINLEELENLHGDGHRDQQTIAALMDVIATAEDGIALLHDEKFVYLNQQHLTIFGYEDASELIGKSWRELYAKEEIEWLEHYVLPQFMETGYWRGTCRARRVDGTFFDEDVWLKQLPNGRMACFCRDITAIKEAERQSLFNLRLQNDLSELEERFLLFTSHELRTPLGGIGLLADYLNKYSEEIPRGQLIKLSKDISNYVADFRDILERFQVFQTTKETIRYTRTERFNLESMVRDLTGILLKQYRKNIDIELKVDGSMEISSDRSLYKHILQNLISNAIKYSEELTTINVSIYNDKKFVQLTVADQGIGIPQAEQEKILDFMYRASNSEMAVGSGIGLTLVKQCVETLHGTISMESEKSHGTTFKVTLPINHT